MFRQRLTGCLGDNLLVGLQGGQLLQGLFLEYLDDWFRSYLYAYLCYFLIDLVDIGDAVTEVQEVVCEYGAYVSEVTAGVAVVEYLQLEGLRDTGSFEAGRNSTSWEPLSPRSSAARYRPRRSSPRPARSGTCFQGGQPPAPRWARGTARGYSR